MKFVYPAIFDYDENEEMKYSVTFPDIFGGVTCGIDIDDALFMAKDLLKTMLKFSPAQCEIPSSLEQTKLNFPDRNIIMVEVEI